MWFCFAVTQRRLRRTPRRVRGLKFYGDDGIRCNRSRTPRRVRGLKWVV